MSVSLVDVEDAYDEFSFGRKVYAVRFSFIREDELEEKSRQFVLLAGDASFDPKRIISALADSDLVPTKLVDTELMEHRRMTGSAISMATGSQTSCGCGWSLLIERTGMMVSKIAYRQPGLPMKYYCSG